MAKAKQLKTKTLADQLLELIDQSDLTNDALGDQAGVPEATIWRFRKRERGVNLDTAGRLAEVLGADLVVTRRKAKAAQRSRVAYVTGRQESSSDDQVDPELN